MTIYKYEDSILAKNDNGICILVKNFQFYKIPFEEKDFFLQNSKLLSKMLIKDNVFLLIGMLAIIVVTLILYFGRDTYYLIDQNFLIATVFLLINIPIHEFGHILFLKFFYKESKIKIGFKFVFIYPAFYVDTSYSYLLPIYKKIAVYLAGSFLNCLFVLVIYFIYPEYLKYCYIIISNILVNFIPIVKSDGYYAMIAFFKKYNLFKGKRSEFFEDFIRGMIMFAFMALLSYIF